MSVYQQYADTPFQITTEGSNITIRFNRTGPTTGTVHWTIPEKSAGCGSDLPPAYQGILITLDETPTVPEKFPTNGMTYIADSTGNKDLHAGDKIGTALVVGFFANDRVTTSLDITDLVAGKAYYISGHALDNVYQYHRAGVHSYSTPYGDVAEQSHPATHRIRVGSGGEGVDPTDLLGWNNTTYPFRMVLDNDFVYEFDVDGNAVVSYEDLVDVLNYQAKMVGSPLLSPAIPNVGTLFYTKSTNTLLSWNGTTYDTLRVLNDAVAPDIQNVGDYWLNPETTQMYQWDGTTWNPTHTIFTKFNPSKLKCGHIWFDGNIVREWSGTVWIDRPTFLQTIDPALPPELPCNTFWFNEADSVLYRYKTKCNDWEQTIAQLWGSDPTAPIIDQYWFDESTTTLSQWDGVSWVDVNVVVAETDPTTTNTDTHWFNTADLTLWVLEPTGYEEVDVFVWDADPLIQQTGALWWDSVNDTIHQWSNVSSSWVQIVSFYQSRMDPSKAVELKIPSYWVNNSGTYRWDGSEWSIIEVVDTSYDPTSLVVGQIWLNTTTSKYYEWSAGLEWVEIDYTSSATDPYVPNVGDYWFDPSTDVLHRFDGTAYQPVVYSTVGIKPSKGYSYFNTTTSLLMTWNGYGWQEQDPKFTAKLSDDGMYIDLESTMLGSYARVELDVTANTEWSNDMTIRPYPLDPRRGSDGQSSVPSYLELGVGTDGSEDERRSMIDSIRHQLGYPTVEVELTKQQFNTAIDLALSAIRKRSGMAYKRGFYFLDIEPRQQQYKLTDKRNGMNRVVEVMKVHRITSAFLSRAEGQGVYGQLALQHLYQMGSFDLISFHLVSQYIETMEQMFASQITFNWDEDTRTLSIYKDFYKKERALIEVSVERTEQQMLKDRYLKTWIEKYAAARCRLMLAEVRGKYSSLPGAGGGVALNASELASRADADLMDLYDQIDDLIANNPEDYGVGATYILG